MHAGTSPDALKGNPLLEVGEQPPFDRIRAEHAEPAVRHLLDTAGRALAALERGAVPTWDGLMAPLYRLQEPLDAAWGIVQHYVAVMNDPAWRAAQEKLQPDIVAFSLRVQQSRPLFNAMQALRDGAAWATLSGPRRRIVASALLRAELAGIGLDDGPRTEFNRIRQELADAARRFSNHVLDATGAFGLLLEQADEVRGLPDWLLGVMARAARRRGHARAEAGTGPWLVTLEMAVLDPFLKYSERRDLREQVYRAYITRASCGETDNGPLIERMLELRLRAARLLGRRSHAEVSLAAKMAGRVEAVDGLLARLRDAAWPHAGRELAELQAFADRHAPAPEPLRHWDVAFWAERMRRERFAFSDDDLRPYFPFPRVLQGLFDLCERLFDVRIQAADGDAPVWHPDVRYFRILDGAGAPCASFYLDPYSRPETKRGGAWLNPAQPRDGGARRPVAYLVCNQTVPVDGRPSLMSLQEVRTLFHEFGHGLQHLLTTVDDPDAAGLNNIEWDAVELASQFMEHWCCHRATLKGLSRHVQTGEPLSDELYERLAAARVFRSGSTMLRQVYFSMLDMELHARYVPGAHENVAGVKRRIAALATRMPPLPEDRFLCAFQHIFAGAYAAGYYGYKWADVLAADAFAAFEEAGLDDPQAVRATAKRYRDTILALGGGMHPMEVFRAFRGRDPDPDALLRREGLLEAPSASA